MTLCLIMNLMMALMLIDVMANADVSKEPFDRDYA